MVIGDKKFASEWPNVGLITAIESIVNQSKVLATSSRKNSTFKWFHFESVLVVLVHVQLVRDRKTEISYPVSAVVSVWVFIFSFANMPGLVQ